jgi:hypothetical protein
MKHELAVTGGFYTTSSPDLVPGDHAKVGFCVMDSRPWRLRRQWGLRLLVWLLSFYIGKPESVNVGNEWMWLEITSMKGAWPDIVYRGQLRNDPIFIPPEVLKFGQVIEFRPVHIYAVNHDSPLRRGAA